MRPGNGGPTTPPRKTAPRTFDAVWTFPGGASKPAQNSARLWKHITYLQAESPALASASFDVVYCHFVLHDIAKDELEKVIPALAKSLKSAGVLVFREPLHETEKLSVIKRRIEQNGLSLKDSRVTDIPRMGNVLESIYVKP